MKKKYLSIAVASVFTAMVMGCGADTAAEFQTIEFERFESVEAEGHLEETLEEKTEESSEEIVEEITQEEQEEEEFTFADLSKRKFEFCSGAGGWVEEFAIEKDGYFTGKFHDSNMGDTGEGYEDGTLYSSSYSGYFTDLIKINDHTYQMTLEDISYKESTGSEEIRQNVRSIYTDSYCLSGTDTFTIYLPGTPLSEISEDIYFWISWYNQSETELTMIVIVDETNGYGIYSHDRPEPLDDARTTFNNCKESYDYYGEKVSEAITTAEMVEYTGTMYAISDDCLNYIWNLIRYNVDEDKFNEILTEQRAWISEKEATAQEVSSEYNGGSFSTVSYNSTLATLTIERCEELIEYLK